MYNIIIVRETHTQNFALGKKNVRYNIERYNKKKNRYDRKVKVNTAEREREKEGDIFII